MSSQDLKAMKILMILTMKISAIKLVLMTNKLKKVVDFLQKICYNINIKIKGGRVGKEKNRKKVVDIQKMICYNIDIRLRKGDNKIIKPIRN